jgi:hypothetical protein
MEGFNKDQEKALKGRRTMFRAGSEEEKWKIVYLILFPNTTPGRLPSPCKLFITLQSSAAYLCKIMIPSKMHFPSEQTKHLLSPPN